MKPHFKVAVLGIGTELTSGQILNRNGQWISEKMKALGVQTSCHLVVPDDRALILEALDFCSRQADILFVTGGLGPTTDDFTREVIATWTKREMFFDQASWDHIQQRLSSRGILVRESQRQQCYYPEGSTVLFNRNGTANAFTLTHQKGNNPKIDQEIYVLPGPPLEIESVWNGSIAERMNTLTAHLDRYLTESWDCIGAGESEIAHLAETVLTDRPADLALELAYRVHQPYVEFKISYFQSQQQQVSPWIQKLNQTLAPFCVLKNSEDAARLLMEKVKAFQSISILDSISGASLTQRLLPFIKSWPKSLLSSKQIQIGSLPINHRIGTTATGTNQLILSLEPAGASGARVSITKNRQTTTNLLDSPYTSHLMKERELQYFAEMALLFWLKNLQ